MGKRAKFLNNAKAITILGGHEPTYPWSDRPLLQPSSVTEIVMGSIVNKIEERISPNTPAQKNTVKPPKYNK